MRLGNLFDRVQCLWIKAPRKRQMKPKVLKDVGVAPGDKVFILSRRQGRFAAAGEVGLGQRRAQRVKLRNAAGGQGGEVSCVAVGDQRQKVTKRRDLQARELDRGLRCSERCACVKKVVLRTALRQSKRRLQRAMEPVLARRGRHGGKVDLVHIERGNRQPTLHVPPQPRRPEPSQRGVVG